MKVDRIFLDLDDVLNTFTLDALQTWGAEIYDLDHYPRECGFNLTMAARKLSKDEDRLTDEEYWESLDEDFWANVPKSKECDLLIDACLDLVGRKNICILTCPTRQPSSLSGKLQWIQANLPSWLHRQFLVGPCKHFCALPGSLLIDDSEANCVQFRKCGGTTETPKKPWNCGTPIASIIASLRA